MYRVPRVSPGVTASILRSPPSRAMPAPPLPYRPLQSARYYYPGLTVGSSICWPHKGVMPGRQEIPISSTVVEMDRSSTRHLNFSSCLPPAARGLGMGASHSTAWSRRSRIWSRAGAALSRSGPQRIRWEGATKWLSLPIICRQCCRGWQSIPAHPHARL